MTPDRLRALKAAAGKTSWWYRVDDGLVLDVDEYHVLKVVGSPGNPELAASGQLAALAPDLAELAADMADELYKHSSAMPSGNGYTNHFRADELLARFAALPDEGAAA